MAYKIVQHINPVIGRAERCRPKGLYVAKAAPVAGFVFQPSTENRMVDAIVMIS